VLSGILFSYGEAAASGFAGYSAAYLERTDSPLEVEEDKRPTVSRSEDLLGMGRVMRILARRARSSTPAHDCSNIGREL
jgi:hypothetical protein